MFRRADNLGRLALVPLFLLAATTLALAKEDRSEFEKWAMYKLARLFGISTADDDAMDTLFWASSLYCVALGFISRALLKDNGFGRTINGSLAFGGMFVTLYVGGIYFGPFHKHQANVLLISACIGSTVAVVIGAIFKRICSFLLAEFWMGGGRKKPKVESKPEERPVNPRLRQVLNR
jgi:hypothetical protein